MCFMENIGSFSVLPDILVTEELDRHLLLQFESLLQAVSFMGNSHPNTHVLPGIRHGPAINRISSSSLSSVGSRSESSSSNASKPVGAIQQLCSIVTFILGGPMPPTPGNIPLCWEELVDWTEEATILAEVSRSRDFIFNNAKRSRKHSTNSNVRFVAYVAAHETEDALKNLASQTYMERAQFYQESIIIAVTDDDDNVLCLVSLFQFCSYFTLLRRLADSQALIPEDPISAREGLKGRRLDVRQLQGDDFNACLPASGALINREHEDKRDPLSISLDNPPLVVSTHHVSRECSICMDRPEDCVLTCCSHALCYGCDKRWVRKQLCCPFCRQSFSSVKQAVATQWDLSVSAVPLEQIQNDIQILKQHISIFWQRASAAGQDSARLQAILEERYIHRPRCVESTAIGEADGFVVVQELAGIVE